MKFIQNEQHQANSKAAINGVKAAPVGYKTCHVNVSLKQDPNGQWLVIINRGRPMPATDAEVSLWLQLQEALK